jgi:hypothetical protein
MSHSTGSGSRVAHLREHFGLTYHIDCLERAAKSIAGRRVLEVGGALPAELVLGEYGAASWTSVDDRSAYSAVTGVVATGQAASLTASEPAAEGEYVALDGNVAQLPDQFRGRFDVVLSIATFEHLGDLRGSLAAMTAAMTRAGVLLAQVGPVWSGWRGHHVFPDYFSPRQDLTRDLLSRWVPWQHLLMTHDEMRRWAHNLYGGEFAEVVVQSVYVSPRINRLSYYDYFTAFREANLQEAAPLLHNGAPIPPGWYRVHERMASDGRLGGERYDVDCFWAELKYSPPRRGPVRGHGASQSGA